jgi:hypothetical protein
MHAHPQELVVVGTWCLGWGGKAPFSLLLVGCLTGVDAHRFMSTRGDCKEHKVSQPAHSSSFAPCWCSSHPYFSKKPCFPNAGLSHPF